jgi:FtsH-binding integral membrane protein
MIDPNRRMWATVCVLALLGPLALTTTSAAASALPVGLEPAIVGTSAAPSSLETAASRAASLGRTIAFSLIGLALAVSAVVLVFRRDFKEAVGLLVIGVIAVLLASPAGVTVLQDTVSTLFGSS